MATRIVKSGALWCLAWAWWAAAPVLGAEPAAAAADANVVKRVLRADAGGPSLLKADGWQPWKTGFAREGETLLCDNGADAKAQRGVGQTVTLNQQAPQPIVAVAESKAEGVGGGADHDYALYLDLVYADGTSLWGQAAAFATGTHDWQRRQVMVLPEKPVKSLSFWMLLRNHSGKAWFRNATLRTVDVPAGACLFDGVPVVPAGNPQLGLQVRDVAASSHFVGCGQSFQPVAPAAGAKPAGRAAWSDEVLGLKLTCDETHAGDVHFYDVTIEDRQGPRDHALRGRADRGPGAPLAGRPAHRRTGASPARIPDRGAVPSGGQRAAGSLAVCRRQRRQAGHRAGH